LAKKIPDKIYRERLAALRSVGYKLRLNKTAGRKTGSQKSAITRLWKQKRFYLVNQKKNRVEFVKIKGAKLKQATRLLSKEQSTPGGFFFQRPKGVKKGKVRYQVTKKGLRIKISGKVNDLILPIDAKLIVRDPKLAMEQAMKGLKKPRQAQLLINGFNRKNPAFTSAKGFFNYMSDIIPELMERDTQPLSAEEINRIFQLKMIY